MCMKERERERKRERERGRERERKKKFVMKKNEFYSPLKDRSQCYKINFPIAMVKWL